MKQEEIQKKLKKWKNILYVTLIPIICFFLGAFIWSIFGVCFGFMGTSTCYYGLDGFSTALGIIVIYSIYLIVPLILEILDIIFLIVSIIKIIKYKKLLNIDFKS